MSGLRELSINSYVDVLCMDTTKGPHFICAQSQEDQQPTPLTCNTGLWTES